MRLAEHVARIGREEAYTWFWLGSLREKGHFEDPGVDGRIILRWIFRKWDLRPSIWLRNCECGNELLGSIKCGEFLD
jgi:hypothetical protein